MPEVFFASAAKVGRARTRVNKTGALIDQLSQQFVRAARTAETERDKAAASDAQGDFLADKINPERYENEAAYAGTIFYQNLIRGTKEQNQLLQDPDSEETRMIPEDYKKKLHGDVREMFDAFKDSPHRGVFKKIYTNYAAKELPLLRGEHAKAHRQFQTRKTMEAMQNGLDEFGGAAPGINFDEEIDKFMEMSWNKKLIKRGEMYDIVMSIATEHASNGDRRLLDYADKRWNLSSNKGTSVKFKAATNAYERFRWEEGEADANREWFQNEDLSEAGLFTKQMYDQYNSDDDAIKRWGKSQISSWYYKSRAAQVEAASNNYNQLAFEKGLPMSRAGKKEFEDTAHSWLNAALATPGADFQQVWRNFGTRVARQGRPVEFLRREINSYFGNLAVTDDTAELEGFNKTLAVIDILDDTFKSSDMLIDQMGDTAYRNWKLFNYHMANNGGNTRAAVNQVAAVQKIRKERGMTLKLGADEVAQRDELLDNIMSGTHELSDAFRRKFKFLGMSLQRGSDAAFTQDIRRKLSEAYEANVLGGMNPELAMETAGDTVSRQFKYFGNEMQYTAGASIASVIGLPDGAQAGAVERAFENMAEAYGKDPEDLRVKINNGVAMVHFLEDGKPTGQVDQVPAYTIGWIYDMKVAEEEEKLPGESLEAKMADISRKNQYFLSWMGSQTVQPKGKNRKHVIVPEWNGRKAITYGDLLDMGEDDLTAARKHYDNYRKRAINQMLDAFMGVGNKLSAWLNSENSVADLPPLKSVHGAPVELFQSH